MLKVTLTPELLKQLGGLVGRVELCDESGKVLAKVTPLYDAAAFGPLEPQVDEAELDRREAANEREYTTSEVLAYLRSL